MTLTIDTKIPETGYTYKGEAPRDEHGNKRGIFACECGAERVLAASYVVHKKPKGCRKCVSQRMFPIGVPKMGRMSVQFPLRHKQAIWEAMDETRRRLVLLILASRRDEAGKPIPAAVMTPQDYSEAIDLAAGCPDPELELAMLRPRFRVEVAWNWQNY